MHSARSGGEADHTRIATSGFDPLENTLPLFVSRRFEFDTLRYRVRLEEIL
ncbi:hypothetical protein [Thioalkalivibrio sp. HK1]|uniref:hypothetical protein n=1 Tax=Thioalkalivibrio sp. HK1 TaxID=1469245 RepID=UPI0004AFB33F|nr:hypothetical protein [Thioalkalivibrio sp. HK1]